MAGDPRDALTKELFPLPGGWEWRWQDQVFTFQGGAQPPASAFIDAPRPGYVRLVQIRDYASDSHATYVPDSERLRKCSSTDVMIARYGSSAESGGKNSLGRICRGIEGAYNVALAKAVPHADVDSGFLYYLLQSHLFQAPLAAAGARSVQSGFNRDSLRLIPLPVPPLDEQRRIAHILGTLDDKIELNRRMSQTLEEMARALFKSWFVDFDPVRAKAEGRDTGLPKHLADLFPDCLVDSELGEIPKGWGTATIAQLCKSIFSGGTPSTNNSAFWDGSIPWLSSGETRSKFITGTEKLISESGVENSSTRLAPARATVIASAGQGRTRGQTSLLAIDAYVNQSVVALVADPRSSAPLHLFFDLERRYHQFRRVSDGQSSRGSLTTRLLAGLPAIVPPHEIVAAFESLVEDAVARCFASILESQSLREQRELLLESLISRATSPADFEVGVLGR